MLAGSSQRVALFFRQLHFLISAGIPLHDAFHHLVQAEMDPHFKVALERCHLGLTRGSRLSSAMRGQGHVFPSLAVDIVAIGESTGALVSCVDQIAVLCERQLERQQKLVAALTYPLLLAFVMALVIIGFVTVVAPRDSALFASLGDDIPWPSQVLIGLNGVIGNPIVVLGGVFIVAGGVGLFRRRHHHDAGFRRGFDNLALEVPHLGPLLGKLESARALDALSTSLKVGLTFMAAMKNCHLIVRNQSFKDDLGSASRAIEAGDGLGVALRRHTRIPRLATSLVEVGELSGDLDRTVARAARMLDEDVNESLSRLVALAEPLLLGMGGFAAGFIMVALLLPILRLVSTL